ncbi:MAG: hypothetical protein O7A98_07170 [Acidobacteria bacterium]|nr:hypothetical protein [Acidobacteriota bacterium]MCZ6727122.1 hypothetical protein [Acidobacteriota bacterium]
MKIRAFHGLRFDGAADRAGARAAPSYEQINDRLREALHAAPKVVSGLVWAAHKDPVE